MTLVAARRHDTRDASLLLTAVVLGLATLLLIVEPALRFVVVAPGLDLVISTVATLVAAGVSVLALTRFQEQGRSSSALQAAAFAVLAVAGFLFLLAVLTGVDRQVGLDLTTPTQAPVYIWTAARLLAGGLLLAGAWLELNGRTVLPAAGRRTILLALLAFLTFTAVAMRNSAWLPPLVEPSALAPSAGATAGAIAGITPLGATLQLTTAALFFAAAILFRVLDRSGPPRPGLGSLSLGLVIAGFSQVHVAIHPGGYTTLVTTGDVLRLAFYLVLLVGVAAETRADLRALRRANLELERMRESDLVRATLEERGRLAREIHDGLSQDLWYAKLKQARVAQAQELAEDTRTTATEVLGAIDTALADARQAISALRAASTGEAGLEAVVRDVFEDFTDRFGLRGSLDVADELPQISPRGQAEVLRIVQEALNNVRKHADATVVRLRLERDGQDIRISITDNGRGFDPAQVPEDRYGLRTMRERAEMIGARLTIRSETSGGTSVVVEVPVSAAAGMQP